MFYPVRAINTNMLQVVGRSDQLLILEIIKRTLALIPLSLGIFISIYWMLWGNVVNGLIGYLLNSYFSGKYINYSTREQIVDILPSLLFGVTISVCLYLISLINLSYLTTLILQFIIGITLLVILGKSSNIEPYLELKQIVSSSFIKFYNRNIKKQ